MTIQGPISEADHNTTLVAYRAVPQHVTLGYIVGTVSDYALNVMIAIDENGTEAISRIRLTGAIMLDDPSGKQVFHLIGAAAVKFAVVFDVPRSLWRNLPGGRTPVRIRMRAELTVRTDGGLIRGTALHLFPVDGCHPL
jgi:hypothetical protein